MKQQRIKVTQPVLKTRAEAEAYAGQLADLMIQHRMHTNELDAGIKALREQFEGRLGTLEKRIQEMAAVLQNWAESNPSEFAGRKSLDMTHALIGWRLGQLQLKTLTGITWDRVLEKLKSAAAYAGFVRVKEEVDKQAIIISRMSLSDADLRGMGVHIVQNESFFVEPKLTDQATKIVSDQAA